MFENIVGKLLLNILGKYCEFNEKMFFNNMDKIVVNFSSD